VNGVKHPSSATPFTHKKKSSNFLLIGNLKVTNSKTHANREKVGRARESKLVCLGGETNFDSWVRQDMFSKQRNLRISISEFSLALEEGRWRDLLLEGKPDSAGTTHGIPNAKTSKC